MITDFIHAYKMVKGGQKTWNFKKFEKKAKN